MSVPIARGEPRAMLPVIRVNMDEDMIGVGLPKFLNPREALKNAGRAVMAFSNGRSFSHQTYVDHLRKRLWGFLQKRNVASASGVVKSYMAEIFQYLREYVEVLQRGASGDMQPLMNPGEKLMYTEKQLEDLYALVMVCAKTIDDNSGTDDSFIQIIKKIYNEIYALVIAGRVQPTAQTLYTGNAVYYALATNAPVPLYRPVLLRMP